MNLFQTVKNYFTDSKTLLGWGGSSTYFITEHFDMIAGMMLSSVMIVSSVAMNYYQIRATINAERRKEELHRLEVLKLQNLKKDDNAKSTE